MILFWAKNWESFSNTERNSSAASAVRVILSPDSMIFRSFFATDGSLIFYFWSLLLRWISPSSHCWSLKIKSCMNFPCCMEDIAHYNEVNLVFGFFSFNKPEFMTPEKFNNQAIWIVHKMIIIISQNCFQKVELFPRNSLHCIFSFEINPTSHILPSAE